MAAKCSPESTEICTSGSQASTNGVTRLASGRVCPNLKPHSTAWARCTKRRMEPCIRFKGSERTRNLQRPSNPKKVANQKANRQWVRGGPGKSEPDRMERSIDGFAAATLKEKSLGSGAGCVLSQSVGLDPS